MKPLHRRESPASPDTEERLVRGIAVPYDTEIELSPGFFETVAPGSFRAPSEEHTGIKLLWRHTDPIGVVEIIGESEKGLEIQARIAATTLGDDVYELCKTGVIDRFSIGFIPEETEEKHDEDGNLHTRITAFTLREVSLVPWPAYEKATVTNIRETPTPLEGNPMTSFDEPLNEMRESLAQTRADLDALSQSLALANATPTTPTSDTRSAGEFLKALSAGEETAVRAAESFTARAWTGSPASSDATMSTPAWVKDLTRIYDRVTPLKGLFSTGALPAEGMSIEFSELVTNTVAVGIQNAEGADLATGKITTRERTAPVKTFGGYVSLSRQAIERTRLPILANHLNAMTLAAGNASATYFAGIFNETVKSQDARKLTVSKEASALTWSDLASLTVDAVDAFETLGVPLDGLIVDKATFKALASLTASDGRPLMHVSGNGTNTVGEMTLTGLSGDLAGIKVTPHMQAAPGAMGAGIVGCFYSSLALRTYETSLVQLQDENVVNLTRDFSIYRYGAVAAEIPGALLPLKIGA